MHSFYFVTHDTDVTNRFIDYFSVIAFRYSIKQFNKFRSNLPMTDFHELESPKYDFFGPMSACLDAVTQKLINGIPRNFIVTWTLT